MMAKGLFWRLFGDMLGRIFPLCITRSARERNGPYGRQRKRLFSFRTYPHVDIYETALRAALVLRDAMDGKTRPKCLVARRAMIDGVNHGRSQDGPMVDLVVAVWSTDRSREFRDVSVNAGFPWADIELAGPTVTVTYDGADERATHHSRVDDGYRLGRAEHVTLPCWPLDQAMARVRELGDGPKPIVLADFSDNPGGGAYGDDPSLLSAMLEAGLKNAAFGTIVDPEAVVICQRAGVRGYRDLASGRENRPGIWRRLSR